MQPDTAMKKTSPGEDMWQILAEKSHGLILWEDVLRRASRNVFSRGQERLYAPVGLIINDKSFRM